MPETPEQFRARTQANLKFVSDLMAKGLSQAEAESRLADVGGLPTVPTGLPKKPLGSNTFNVVDFLEKQLGIKTNGFATSFDLGEPISNSITADEEAEIRREEERRRGLLQAKIAGQFEPLIEEAQKRKEQEVGVARAMGTRFAGGLGLDTATQGFIQAQEELGQKRIRDLEREKKQALLDIDLQAAQNIQARIDKENERLEKLRDAQINRFLQLANLGINIQRLQLQQDKQYIDTISSLPAGETFTGPNGITYTGIAEPEPFFKSSDLLKMAEQLNIGESNDIVDPNTGIIWHIEGVAQPKPNTKTIQTTNKNTGEVILTTYDMTTGDIVNQVSAGRVGERFKPTKPTVTERIAPLESEAQQQLLESIQPDNGFVSINDFRRIRGEFASRGLPIDKFNIKFRDFLSASDRAKFNIGTASGFTATGEIKDVSSAAEALVEAFINAT